MLARVPLKELFPSATKVNLVPDDQFGCVPVQRLSLSARYLRPAGTVSVQSDPILLLLRSSVLNVVLANVNSEMPPLSELPLRDKVFRTADDQVKGSCPMRLDENAKRLTSAGICDQLAGIVPPISLLEMEMVCRLPIGLLVDPHCGSGATMLEEDPINVSRLVIAAHSGSVPPIGLLLMSRVVRVLQPLTTVGSGLVMELLCRPRYVSSVEVGHWGRGPPRPLLEMVSEVSFGIEVHAEGNVAPAKLALMMPMDVMLARLFQVVGRGPVMGVL